MRMALDQQSPPVASMTPDATSLLPPGWALRSWHLALNAMLFGLCYPLTNFLAQQRQVQAHLAFPFEQATPFLQWMILPYMSSGLLFATSFYAVRDRAALSLLSRRMLLSTLGGCLLFAWLPLRFDGARPAIDATLPRLLYSMLDLVDRPYNQLPSLHVAYCLLYWTALRDRITAPGRLVLASWLLLVAASTVLTYQHRLADVAAGALLGAGVIGLLRATQSTGAVVAQHYALGAALTLLGIPAWRTLPAPPGWQSGLTWLSVYLAASLLLVSLAYVRRDRHFLHKRHGRHPPWVWMLYAPYLASYRLTWQLVRLRERHQPPFTQWRERLWVGRRLSEAEADTLPAGCAVIDLANELSETTALCARAGRHYHHVPLLDLHAPERHVIAYIHALMASHARRGRPLYLHCAMGYQRSRLIATLFLEMTPP